MNRLFKSDPVAIGCTGLLVTFLFSIIACSTSDHTRSHEAEHSHAHHMPEEHAEAQQSTHLSDLEALYWARLEASRQSFTQADVDFMTDMIAHHAQALIMSELAPQNGANRSVQTLAARIYNAQKDEIATMQKWLRDRNQPVPKVHIDGLILMIQMVGPDSESAHDHATDHDEELTEHHHGHHHHQHEEEVHTEEMHPEMMMAHHHHHDMPGMLTQEQLEELSEAKNEDFDRKFLIFMIEHHLGAVYMVDQLFASDGAGNDHEIFDLASDIHAEQVTEINRMRLMLQEMGIDPDFDS